MIADLLASWIACAFLRYVQMDATLLADNSHVHVAFVGSCGAKFETSQTFCPVQTGATLLVVQFCFRLYAALPSCWYRVIFGFVNFSANFSKSYKLLADRKRSRGPRLGFLSGEA